MDISMEGTVPAMPWALGSGPELAACSTGQREPATTATIELFTVNQVAVAMRVSKMTVYRLIHAGTLRAVRIDGSLRLHRDSVEAFVCAAMRMRSGS
jgi:excisionase family DNA binding protein